MNNIEYLRRCVELLKQANDLIEKHINENYGELIKRHRKGEKCCVDLDVFDSMLKIATSKINIEKALEIIG